MDNTGRATALYDAIPAQLSKNASRYQIASAIPGERAERVAGIVKMMNNLSDWLLRWIMNALRYMYPIPECL